MIHFYFKTVYSGSASFDLVSFLYKYICFFWNKNVLFYELFNFKKTFIFFCRIIERYFDLTF